MSTECDIGHTCEVETAQCIPDVCEPILLNHTNVVQRISSGNDTEHPSSHKGSNKQLLNLSCPKNYVLYDAGMVQKYRGISNGIIDSSTNLTCEKHEDNRYWQTAQGGKLLYPTCMSMPGCNCLKGEM